VRFFSITKSSQHLQKFRYAHSVFASKQSLHTQDLQVMKLPIYD